MKLRALAVLTHRYVGLALAIFLVMSGLTGSIIAFNHELDAWLNPSLFERTDDKPAMAPLDLIAAIEKQAPNVFVSFFEMEDDPDHNAVAFVTPRENPETGEAPDPGFNQIFADPATGRIVGKREWGAFAIDAPHLIPFLYKLHYTLHIPGVWGILLMGVVGIVWMFDSLVGFYLTLPQTGPFWRKWTISWKVKRGASPHRRNLDLHRAGGLWFWGVLFVLAMSGAALNLPDQVARPIVSLFSNLQPSLGELAEERLKVEYEDPASVGFREALALANPAAKKLEIEEKPSMLWYPKAYSAIAVGFGEEHGSGLGPSWIIFDDHTGKIIHTLIPGTGSAGDTFMEAQFPLHSGQIIGLPGRILISVTGIVVAVLSITGILIWAKKRKGALARKRARLHDGAGSLPRPKAEPAE